MHEWYAEHCELHAVILCNDKNNVVSASAFSLPNLSFLCFRRRQLLREHRQQQQFFCIKCLFQRRVQLYWENSSDKESLVSFHCLFVWTMNTGSFTDDSADYSDFWLMNSTTVMQIFSSTNCYWSKWCRMHSTHIYKHSIYQPDSICCLNMFSCSMSDILNTIHWRYPITNAKWSPIDS